MKTKILHRIIIASVFALASGTAAANGCIIVRSSSPLALGPENVHDSRQGKWEYTLGYRYLFSDRHFRGGQEQVERQIEGTDVRNTVHLLDHNFTYYPNDVWHFTASLPMQWASRSSLYEHDRVSRHSQDANGIGDLRLMVYREMFGTQADPSKGLTLGLGLKLPTGKDDVQDIAYRPEGPELRNVDQSIQPGDGGTGVIGEIQAYHTIFDEQTFAYFTASYLVNPEGTNGVETNRRPTEAIMSVPDSYVVRTGVARILSPEHGITGDLAFRMEGVPVEDLVGDSDGFRRPGYAVYIEPGLSVQAGPHRFNLSTPIAIKRNRKKSVPDIIDGRHGDAAFADSLLLITYSYRW